jgi:hypothetical protein
MGKRCVLAGAALLCLAAASVFAAAPHASEQTGGPDQHPTAIDNSTVIDVNNIRMIVTNHGSFAYDLTNQDGGLWYPGGGDKTCVFASGFWVGAKVAGDVRITPGSYIQEYTPGPILDGCAWPEAGAPEHKVYKIERGDTTSYDYRNWPWRYGAPYDSLIIVGEDTTCVPALPGHQTLWCVYNDADPSVHYSDEGSSAADPLGIEVQQTAYAFGGAGALGNVVFMEFKVINKCTNTMDSTHFSIWCDPDIGSASDDYVGCDPNLGLGFAYNATDSDPVYGSNPPAVGYDILEGPRGDRGEQFRMTAFNMYTNGTDPRSKEESWNYMRGFDLSGNEVIDPTTGEPTKYMLSGDPVAGTGWLDSDPGDRRFMMTSGPFTMAPGDTQEIAIAIVVGQAADRIQSVALMKAYDVEAQRYYRWGTGGPVFPSFEASAGENEVYLTWENPSDADFVETLIKYSNDGYPAHPGMDLPVPNGCGGRFTGSPGGRGSFIHTGLGSGMTYYYTAFAFGGECGCNAIGHTMVNLAPGGAAGVVTSAYTGESAIEAVPNPPGSRVAIRYSLASDGPVELAVYNAQGQVVRRLFEDLSACYGSHETTWDTCDENGMRVAPGIYFVTLRSGGDVRATKLTVAR